MINKEEILHKINTKTKPLGALGLLEKLALQICLVQDTLRPTLINPTVFVFAADHGIALEGVSAYPQDVTWQMVLNFLHEGAAINVFAKQNNITVKVIDAGVNKDFDANSFLIDAKVAKGTKSFLREKAMTKEELTKAMLNGKKIIQNFKETNPSNIVGFGEMGIGNTSSASLLMHYFTSIPLEQCIGKGTGINEEQFQHKQKILHQALQFHALTTNDPLEILQTFGGFEIASITAAMLACYEHNVLILVDGFIASTAFLAAYKINPQIIDNTIFCHQSDESGHALLINYLKVEPLLKLNMRLGEGSGCAVAYPIIKSAVAFINEMASFESASVSNKV